MRLSPRLTPIILVSGVFKGWAGARAQNWHPFGTAVQRHARRGLRAHFGVGADEGEGSAGAGGASGGAPGRGSAGSNTTPEYRI